MYNLEGYIVDDACVFNNTMSYSVKTYRSFCTES